MEKQDQLDLGAFLRRDGNGADLVTRIALAAAEVAARLVETVKAFGGRTAERGRS